MSRKKSQTLVSIVIPAYNAEHTIIETLESVLKQTYNNIETIIVNDGSTDCTLEVIGQFIADKPTFRVYSKENEGLAPTRNYGFQFVKGKYLVFLDADDLIDPDFVRLCAEQFEVNDQVDIVTTQVQHFERENHIYIPPTFSIDTLLRVNCFIVTSMIKSEAFRDIGLFDETMKFHEDWEMWIRMTEKYSKVVHIDRPLFWYRKRNSRDSMCDLLHTKHTADETQLYIYQKHFKRYLEYGYSLKELFDGLDRQAYWEKKYRDVWYRKLFYQIFKGK